MCSQHVLNSASLCPICFVQVVFLEYISLGHCPFCVFRRFILIWLWKIHTHLLTFCFLYHLITCAPSWTNFVTTKLNMKILAPKMVMAPIISNNLHNSFKMWQCDWKHSNTHVMKNLFCFGLKFCTNVKNKYEKRTFDHYRKKSLNLQK
jgi:hypothetical protein